MNSFLFLHTRLRFITLVHTSGFRRFSSTTLKTWILSLRVGFWWFLLHRLRIIRKGLVMLLCSIRLQPFLPLCSYSSLNQISPSYPVTYHLLHCLLDPSILLFLLRHGHYSSYLCRKSTLKLPWFGEINLKIRNQLRKIMVVNFWSWANYYRMMFQRSWLKVTIRHIWSYVIWVPMIRRPWIERTRRHVWAIEIRSMTYLLIKI